MEQTIINNLKAFLFGGEGAPEFAPEGLLNLRKLTVERLARASNVTRTAVYNYTKNINRPTIETLRRMCEALDVPVELGLQYCTPSKAGRPSLKKSEYLG